jgi:hypothetical protein
VAGVGSVFVRRVKKPNLEVLLGLGAGAGACTALDLRVFRSFWTSGVGPRVGTRVVGGNADDGFGDGSRETGFVGTVIFDLTTGDGAFLDSVDPVRLCELGKCIILLWMTGDGPRSPRSSGVPSRLGLDGRLGAGSAPGDCSTK